MQLQNCLDLGIAGVQWQLR
uniref:Uncharacterized protein n=1 Tax=Musa acuminata subsp. malaccensis TaxID=214687 RepID=A0A804JN66_MUSAM